MSVCFLTCAMCKKVLQNLIPLAQWPIDEKSCGACCCQCQEEICRATGQVVSCIKLTEEKSQKHFSQHLTAKWSLELFTLQKICQKRKAKCYLDRMLSNWICVSLQMGIKQLQHARFEVEFCFSPHSKHIF